MAPQLRRIPLGSYNILHLFRLALVAFVFLIGCNTVLVGIRDGMVRRRIRSRWHRDRRELTGNAALWAGASTTGVGVGVIGLAVWLVLKVV